MPMLTRSYSGLHLHQIAYGAYAVAVAVGLWVGVTAMINAPAARAMVELQRAAEMAQENRTMCAEIGMPPETAAFGRCTSILTQVRQRHEERWMRDFDMMGGGPVIKTGENHAQ